MTPFVAGLAASLALAGHGPAHQLALAEKGTGHSVRCYVSQSEWRTEVSRFHSAAQAGDIVALWLADEEAMALSPAICRPLFHPRSAAPEPLAFAIFALGHEATHAEQQADGRPFDEHEADCGGIAKFPRLKRLLAPTRSLIPPAVAGWCAG